MPHELYITKADGSKELFQMKKLRNSLKRAGAKETEIDTIVRHIDSQLVDGITTEALYHLAFTLLRENEKISAARYSLRRAMIGLGPTGFPFEDYLAKLFAAQGYTTRTRAIIKGKCVAHEIDVVAYKEGASFVAEAKFHAQPGMKSDLQVILYSYARFLDIAGTKLHNNENHGTLTGKVITNTKFTTTAIQYAKCVGMELLSWDFPRKGNLQDMIESSRLYPVTVLQTLSMREKRSLLETGNVLCSDIIDNHNLLSSIGVPRKKMPAIMDEGVRLCTIQS